MSDVAPQIVDVISNGSIGALTISAAVLIIGWYRRQTTDAELLYGGRLDQLRKEFDAYRVRTDAQLARTDTELAQHRKALDECQKRETNLMLTEHELRSEVAALRRRIDTNEQEHP